MSSKTRAKLTANQLEVVVLCGGEGRRMGGQDKPLLAFGDARLIDYVFAALPDARSVVLCANRNLAAYRSLQCAIVEDLEPGLGPLGGLASCQAQLTADYVYVVPGDAPLLPSNLSVDLFDVLREQNQQSAVCSVGDRLHYLPTLIKRSALPELHGYLASGGRSVKGWLDRIGCAHRRRPASETGFVNINTPEELATAEALLDK